MTRRLALISATVVALAIVVVFAAVQLLGRSSTVEPGAATASQATSGARPGADTANGTGLTFDGRFYWASSEEVAADKLGAVVATSVQFQDTRADLRTIAGFDPAVALAALLPPLTGGGGGPRWTFTSVDQDHGVNPRGYAETSAVLVPAP